MRDTPDRKERPFPPASPFEEELVFSEQETLRVRQGHEYRMRALSEESPFLQAFVEDRPPDSPLDEETAGSAFAEDEDLTTEFEPEEEWKVTAPWQPEYEPEMDTESYEVQTPEVIDEADEYSGEEFNAEEESADQRGTEDGEVVWEENEGNEEGVAIADDSSETYQLPCDDLERIPTDFEGEFEQFFDEENGIRPDDTRIDVRAKFALPKMLKRPDMQADAQRLIAGINNGQLAGIYGNDLGIAVKVAKTHNRNRFQLIPKGEDGSLVLSATNPLNEQPTVFFRGDDPDISKQPQRFFIALQKTSQTFKLWLDKQIRPCIPGSTEVILNLIPEGNCLIVGSDLVVKVVADDGLVVNGAAVQILGPFPAQTVFQKNTVGGEALFPALSPGKYHLTVKKDGHRNKEGDIIHNVPAIGNGHEIPSSQPKQQKKIVTLPRIQLQPYPNQSRHDDMAYLVGINRNDRIIECLPGSHTAVRLINTTDSIWSNNPNVIQSIIVQREGQSNAHDLFFSCKISSAGDTTLLQDHKNINSRNNPETVLQVRARQVKNAVYIVQLHGRSLSLNASDRGIFPYRLTIDKTDTDSSGRKISPDKLVNMIASESRRQRINHLVINAHGEVNRYTKEASIRIGYPFFDRNRLSEWDRLRGYVDYIWLSSCNIAADKFFCFDIAKRTQAWVTAYGFSNIHLGGLGRCQIDFHYRSLPNHWNGKRSDQNSDRPDDSDAFFQSARYKHDPMLRGCLHFNVIGARVP